ncbi:MAG: HAMP domain-containing histidine kinase [Clostridiales bacterium]|nr:HAMP domain-containing histidine kinase [Clostridiales bacterium]
MIRGLRRKLIVVLMTILCLLLVAVFVGMFFSAKVLFERRSSNAFNKPPPVEGSTDRPYFIAVPIATVTIDAFGNYTVTQNQIHYVTDEELIQIAASLRNNPDGVGTASTYDLRYQRYVKPDGTVSYSFTDTYIERDSLNTQITSSVVIGIGALALFFLVSILLSRWMVKPVERAWNKQRQFIADASHELKTPLTVILSNAEMLAESGTVKDKTNRMRLENIRAESKRMKALTDTLLSIAHGDSNQKKPVHEPVDFSFVLSGAVLMFEPAVFDQGREISSEIEDHIIVSGDQNQLRRLADILIDNAIRYGADGSPIFVRLASGGKKEALLSVVSEGTPLSDEDRKRIFERFYRVDASRGQTTGFGLGLSIASGITEEHKGKIWAESDGEKRNTFYVKLPVQSVSS